MKNDCKDFNVILNAETITIINEAAVPRGTLNGGSSSVRIIG